MLEWPKLDPVSELWAEELLRLKAFGMFKLHSASIEMYEMLSELKTARDAAASTEM